MIKRNGLMGKWVDELMGEGVIIYSFPHLPIYSFTHLLEL